MVEVELLRKSFSALVSGNDGCVEKERACISMIFKTKPSLSFQEVMAGDEEAEVYLLLMKRAVRESDSWSGHVCFPGGRKEHGETSYITAVRETREEIGLDLDTPNFLFVGKGPSATVNRFKNSKFSVGVFIFYQECEITPPLTLEPKEVSSVRWVRLLSIIRPQNEYLHTVTLPRSRFPCVARVILYLLCIHSLYLPAVILQSSGGVYDKREDEYCLWGMTYSCIMDVLLLNRPLPIRTGNSLMDNIAFGVYTLFCKLRYF